MGSFYIVVTWAGVGGYWRAWGGGVAWWKDCLEGGLKEKRICLRAIIETHFPPDDDPPNRLHLPSHRRLSLHTIWKKIGPIFSIGF